MLDSYNRTIDYLRISVTDRCNLRCEYCMPETGIKQIPQQEILSFEQITEVARAAIGLGIRRIKLTGGEPLVRKGIVQLTANISCLPGLEELSMTTNGILLAEYAPALVKAGLRRVNISLDTVDAAYYKKITRGGNIECVMLGIAAARTAGLVPIKLNCVVENSPDEPHAKAVAAFACTQQLAVQFIRRMDPALGIFHPVAGGMGGLCRYCNRLRLTSNGIVKPCLFNDMGFRIQEWGIEESLKKAILYKPEAGKNSQENTLYNMGG